MLSQRKTLLNDNIAKLLSYFLLKAMLGHVLAILVLMFIIFIYNHKYAKICLRSVKYLAVVKDDHTLITVLEHKADLLYISQKMDTSPEFLTMLARHTIHRKIMGNFKKRWVTLARPIT